MFFREKTASDFVSQSVIPKIIALRYIQLYVSAEVKLSQAQNIIFRVVIYDVEKDVSIF
jgi:hypothetical protein